jgi:hypothetical protein
LDNDRALPRGEFGQSGENLLAALAGFDLYFRRIGFIEQVIDFGPIAVK